MRAVGVISDRCAGSPGATVCLIALGSNLGDRLAHLRAGIAMLGAEHGIEVIALSALYETAPVGGPQRQEAYFNAALMLRTSQPARTLLATLHRVESQRQRERIVRWGPRTLDLDLLTYGDMICEDNALQLPHPRMHLRRFVMAPVCDIAPEMRHPVTGQTMRDHLQALPEEPGDLTRIMGRWADDEQQGYMER